MPEEMALVARATTIPVATGERLCTKYEFARVLACRAASILQMALGRVGGLLEAKKIAGMAEAHYCQVAPHLYCGPVEGAANIQLSACIPNFLILESIRQWDGFHARILKKPICWEDGYVIPSEEPGLGVELDEDVALAHPYAGDRLHLEMADRPVD
jgi:2-dehydro-3-deoxyphosphogalactonate aldolase